MEALSQHNQYQYLFIRQLRQQIKLSTKFKLSIKQMQVFQQQNYRRKQFPSLSNKQIIKKYYQQFKNTKQGIDIIDFITQKVKRQAQKLHQYDSKRKAWMVDCLRQATSYPFIQNQSIKCFNFQLIYKQYINKNLRRLLWNRKLITQQSKKQFFQYDHVLSPYNIQQELILYTVKVASKQNIKLKENQKDLAVRLLQYNVKKNKKLPYQNQYYLALSIIENHSFFTVKKAHQMGSIYVSLLNLTKYYYIPNLSKRFNLILLAIQLVDPQTYQILKQRYFKGDIDEPPYQQLNEAFQSFRLTFGSNFLPLVSSYFLIDQLLVKKRHYFDMYVLFALALMTISDQFQKDPKFIPTFKQIVTRSKSIIQPKDFIDAFRVCYEKIPAYFDRQNLSEQITEQKNYLLEKMIQMEYQLQKENLAVEIPSSKNLQLNQKNNNDKNNDSKTFSMDKFIYEEDRQVFRLGQNKNGPKKSK